MSGALAIFVKTPGFSPVKTRLAVQLGKDNAQMFHLASAKAVAAIAKAATEDASTQCYFAVAEHSALHDDNWQSLTSLWQGEGGLGERMANIYQHLLDKHDFAVLVGADSPQMLVTDLSKALSLLSSAQSNQMVFGPSLDGGFWLFGGNCEIPHPVWTSVKYSQSDTGDCFYQKIQHYGKIHLLNQMLDVDEPEDLLLLSKSLIKLSNPLPEQQALMQLLDRMPIHNLFT